MRKYVAFAMTAALTLGVYAAYAVDKGTWGEIKSRLDGSPVAKRSSLKDAVKWNRRRLPEGRSGSPGFDAAVWVDRFPELVDDLGDFWCHGHSSPVL